MKTIENIIKEFEEKFVIFERPQVCVGGFLMVDCGGVHNKLKEISPNIIRQSLKEATHCQKLVENGKAVCGVKLDCHLHDWRQKNYLKEVLESIMPKEAKDVDDVQKNYLKEVLESIIPKEAKDVDDVRLIIYDEKWAHLRNQKMGIACGWNSAREEIINNINKFLEKQYEKK